LSLSHRPEGKIALPQTCGIAELTRRPSRAIDDVFNACSFPRPVSGASLMSFLVLSVGRGGANLFFDVMTVQNALNNITAGTMAAFPLVVTGSMDAMTETKIAMFQRQYMPSEPVTGLLEPRSLAVNLLFSISLGGGTKVSTIVTYAADIPAAAKIVDPYCFSVIEKALVTAKMSAAKITSTIRLAPEQAAIMYRNAKADFAQQYAMYEPFGKLVLDVYKANSAKPKAVVISLMTAKIEELYAKGQLVSSHISTMDMYKTKNIIDIGMNGTRAVAGKTFNIAALTKAFRSLEKEGYINKFIDETAKTNKCWHLEIVPNAKKL
jgi:hypothetical protein